MGPMATDPAPRAVQIVGLGAGIVLVLTCLTVQVFSQQPAMSAFRIIWDVLGLAGAGLVVAYARVLRGRRRPASRD